MPYARTAVVQPGVRNLAISEAAAPSTACTTRPIRLADRLHHRRQRRRELGRRALPEIRPDGAQRAARARGTIDGDVIELGGEALDAPGLDLLAVFIGSEGMLGIVTEVTVKLVPKPALAQVIMASFDDVVTGRQCGGQRDRGRHHPGRPGDDGPTSSRMVEPFVKAGYDLDAAAILLCEADGTALEVAEEIERMTAVLQEAGASAIAVSQNEAERLRFWSGRKNAFPAAGRISPDYYCMDGTIPRKHLAQVLAGIEEMEDTYGLRCATCSMPATATCIR
jgi:glycolate oxidase